MPLPTVGLMLSDLDRAILDIEDARWNYGGRKLAAINALGLTDVQYARRLAELARDPEAALDRPLLVARLQRRLESAKRQRGARRGSLTA